MPAPVDFMLIGAQKSGTTSLSSQLAQHPDIAFCDHKEPDYFSKSEEWTENLEKYHRSFPQAPGKLWGEASTTYSWYPEYPETAQRLAAYNPELRLIYIMRQPVERIRSHYTYELLKARTHSPPDIEVLENPTYVNRSRYGVQLNVFQEFFPKESILPIVFEEYVLNPSQTLACIAAHLNIDPKGFDGIDLEPQNRSADRPAEKKIKKKLTRLAKYFPLWFRDAVRGPFVYSLDRRIELAPETQKALWHLLADDVLVVERLLGRRLDIWRESAPNGVSP